MRAFLPVIAAACLCPVAARAQATPAPDSVQRTHTVKRKDTLWDLAQSYLGDPFKWPAIYQINRDVVDDPHWIYPGEVLKIPGMTAAPATIAEAPQVEAPKPDSSKAEAPKPDSSKVEAEKAEPELAKVEIPKEDPFIAKPQAGAVNARPSQDPTFTNYDATIFVQTGRRRDATERPKLTPAVQPPVSTVRLGEFLAAPFVDQAGGPRGAGHLIERADLSGIPELGEQEVFQLYDRVLVSPPAGNVGAEGERYTTYRFGPYIDNVGQVVIPTGVVEVLRAPRHGEAAIARVVRVFSEMRPNQRLVPFDSSALATRGSARTVADGRWASVQWVQSEPVLPSVQNYVVLNISSRDGVQLGDEFELFRRRIPPQDGGELAKPEISIAKAQVVRVTPFGTTVLIKSQEQPAIEKGTMARISAKMP